MNQDFGRRAIEKALLYANHEWFAQEQNLLHGMDEAGRYVDTPDVSWKGEALSCGWWKANQINRGIPYCWGKASTLEEFDRGIALGKYAGNVPEDTSRKGSHQCVGVDCSGLVTVCWGLPEKIRARDIPGIAVPIQFEELQPGDVLAIASHVMLFQAFLNGEKQRLRIIDATRSTGKVSRREFCLEDLVSQGFAAYRKR